MPTVNLRTALGALLVVAIVITGTVPLPIAAQGADENSVLLDSSREKIADVSVDGQAYTIYEYENVLPYASGIEVYTNGQRVTDEAEARHVARAIAWQRAAGGLDSTDIETLRQIDESAQQINQIVTPLLDVLNQALAVIDELKQRQIAGQSAWDLVTDASPALAEFETAARELRSELQEWKTAADAVNENVPRAIDDAERIKRGENVDYSKVSQHFTASVKGTDQLQSQSAEVRDGLASTAETASRASSEVRSVPIIGGDLSQFYAQAGTQLNDASGNVGEFSDALGRQKSQLADIKATADSEEKQMMSTWNARQTAEIRVYGTLGGAVVLVFLIPLMVIGRTKQGSSSKRR
jgi:hypothetical protein